MESRDLFFKKLDAGVESVPAVGPLLLNVHNQEIINIETGASDRLTKSEYLILWPLVRSPDTFFKEAEMLDFMYEDRSEDKDLPLSNTLQTLLTRVRRKLEGVVGNQVTVENIVGMGYKLTLENKSIQM